MVNYLYIHIPFCAKKCFYCDFNSIPFDSNLVKRYITAICKEIKRKRDIIGCLKTIYIGGGTPTILNEGSLQMLLNTLKDSCLLEREVEITVEANPESISEKKCEEMLTTGINRISIGLQSLNDYDLQILGRLHSSYDGVKAVKLVKKSGFKNVSLDLIYGIPRRQSYPYKAEDDLTFWCNTLHQAISFNPEHISIYELTLESNTPLYNQILSKNLLMPDENLVSEMYYAGTEMLEKHGYIHYEISNFSKPGYECRHNLNYWVGEDYLGIGAGAHSFVKACRYSNISDVNQYIKASEEGKDIKIDKIELSCDDILKELIFLGLRKTKGIELKKIPDDLFLKIKPQIDDLRDYELLEIKDNFLRLTSKGLILSNEVMIRLIKNI